jgi:hypothetical protein
LYQPDREGVFCKSVFGNYSVFGWEYWQPDVVCFYTRNVKRELLFRQTDYLYYGRNVLRSKGWKQHLMYYWPLTPPMTRQAVTCVSEGLSRRTMGFYRTDHVTSCRSSGFPRWDRMESCKILGALLSMYSYAMTPMEIVFNLSFTVCNRFSSFTPRLFIVLPDTLCR